ncbi:MAG: hypothetical protein AAF721_31515 [Myxococcota bacterium]
MMSSELVMTDRRDDILRHFETLLGRWRGARARLWELSSSHATLSILLTRDEGEGCLLIHCVSPTRIEAPRHWSHADIRVATAEEVFDLIDDAAGVRISNCGVEVKEHPKRPWD